MHFQSDNHKLKFEAMQKRDKTRRDDFERLSLFYLLSIEPFASRVDDLYDFDDHSILLYKSGNKADGVDEKTACSDFSASERVMLACAYYLYNCYTDKFLTITNLFGYRADISLTIMTAISIRYELNFMID